MEEAEVHVRSLQEEVLRLMRQLRKLVDGYLEEMRRIEDKVRCSDEQCLRSKFAGRRGRLKKGTWSRENVFQFRDGVLKVVDDLGAFRTDLCAKLINSTEDDGLPSTFSNLEEPQVQSSEVKTEPSAYQEEETEELSDDFRDFAYSPVEAEEDNSADEDYIVPDSPKTKRKRSSRKLTNYSKSNSTSQSEDSEQEEEPEKKPVKSRKSSHTNKPSWCTATRKTFSNGISKGTVRTFSCVTCPTFSARDQFHFEQHLRTHENSYEDKPKTLICPECQMAFAYQQYFDFHMYCHSGVFKAKCDQCWKSVNCFDLEEHLRTQHNVENIYKCANCIQLHSTRPRFLGHMAKHIGNDVIFNCGLCSKTFPKRAELSLHLKQEHSEGSEDNSILQAEDIKQEPESKEPNDNVPKLKVKKLLKSKQNAAAPKVKRKRVPKSDWPDWYAITRELPTNAKAKTKRYFRCLICSKYETRYMPCFDQHLRAHDRKMLAEADAKTLQCPECPSIFGNEQTLDFHMHCHNGMIRTTCDLCRVSVGAFQLQKHMKEDHGIEKIFSCASCVQVHSSREKYLKHLDYHVNLDNLLACDLCPETFSRKKYLLDHYEEMHELLDLRGVTEVTQGSKPKEKAVTEDESSEGKPPGWLPLSKRQRPVWYQTTRFKDKNSADQKFLCETCSGFSCATHYQLEQHLRGHEKNISPEEKKLECPHCPSVFGVQQHFELHLCYHQGVFEVICDQCCIPQLTLAIKDHLQECHQVEKLFPCENCYMVNSDRESRLAHLYNYHAGQDASFGCDLCPMVFELRKNLIEHLKLDHGIEVKCQREQKRKQSQIECKNRKERVLCPQCGKSLKSISLKEHLEVVHNSARPHKCSEPNCEKAFKTKAHLKEHLITHRVGKNQYEFQCHLCSKQFRLKGSFMHHMRIHEGKGFTCEQCGKMFGNRTGLNAHLKVHQKNEGRRWWQCDRCEFKYATKEKLEKHWKVHRKQSGTEHRCLLCNKVFHKLAYLKIHHKGVHSGERFSCKFCVKAYTSEATLRAHKRQCHPEEYQKSLVRKRKPVDEVGSASGVWTSTGCGNGPV